MCGRRAGRETSFFSYIHKGVHEKVPPLIPTAERQYKDPKSAILQMFPQKRMD